jgi:hypothetical protein
VTVNLCMGASSGTASFQCGWHHGVPIRLEQHAIGPVDLTLCVKRPVQLENLKI